MTPKSRAQSHVEPPLVLYGFHSLPNRPETPPCKQRSTDTMEVGESSTRTTTRDACGSDTTLAPHHETIGCEALHRKRARTDDDAALDIHSPYDSEEEAHRHFRKRRRRRQKLYDERIGKAEKGIESLLEKHGTLKEGHTKCENDVDSLQTQTVALQKSIEELSIGLPDSIDKEIVQYNTNLEKARFPTLVAQARDEAEAAFSKRYDTSDAKLADFERRVKKTEDTISQNSALIADERKERRDALIQSAKTVSNNLSTLIDERLATYATTLVVPTIAKILAPLESRIDDLDGSSKLLTNRLDRSDTNFTTLERRLAMNERNHEDNLVAMRQNSENYINSMNAYGSVSCRLDVYEMKMKGMEKTISDFQHVQARDREEIQSLARQTVEMNTTIENLQKSHREDKNERNRLTVSNNKRLGDYSSLKADVKGLKVSHAGLEKKMEAKIQEVEKTSKALQDAQAAEIERLEAKISSLEEQLRTACEERMDEASNASQEAVLEKLETLEQKVATIAMEQKDWKGESILEHKRFTSATESVIQSTISFISIRLNALEEKHKAKFQGLVAKLDQHIEDGNIHAKRMERELRGEIKDQGFAIRSEYETVRDRLRELKPVGPANPEVPAQLHEAFVQLHKQQSDLTSRMENFAAVNNRLRTEKIKIPLLAKRIKTLEDTMSHISLVPTGR